METKSTYDPAPLDGGNCDTTSATHANADTPPTPDANAPLEGNPKSKIKSSAKLKSLPRERQEMIAEWCDKPNELDANGVAIPKTGGLAYAVNQLEQQGISVALGTVSKFHSWWRYRMRCQETLEFGKDAQEAMKGFKPGDLKIARQWGEYAILQRANVEDDPKLFKLAAGVHDAGRKVDLLAESLRDRRQARAGELALGRERLLLDRDRFEFDGAQAVLDELPTLKEIAQDSGLSLEQKIAQVRVRLWGPPPPELAHLDWKPKAVEGVAV